MHHPEALWTCRFLKVSVFNAYNYREESETVWTNPDISIFDAFGEAHLCLLENSFVSEVFLDYFI